MSDVSRETAEKLTQYAALVRKWSPRINLVSQRDLPHLEDRHLRDSLQVADLAPQTGIWCDLGSGGGFPGLVVSIARPDLDVRLLEPDQRKATFLRTVRRDLDLGCTILCQRAEDAPPQDADIVSARALAPLKALLALATRHGTARARYIFPKGARYEDELAEARRIWRFDVDVRPSRTEKGAVILILENIERV